MNNQQIILNIQWLGIASVRSLNWHDSRTRKYFSSAPHLGLLNGFDIPRQHQVVPYLLTPRDGFHLITSRSLRGLLDRGERSRTPYELVDNRSGEHCTVNSISGELFPGEILISRVKGRASRSVSSDEHALDTDLASLRTLRTPRSTEDIGSIIREMIALVQADRRSDRRAFTFADYFIMHVQLPFDHAEFRNRISSLSRDAVSLLIGAPDASDLGTSVVNSVLIENGELNEKVQSELLLLNSQGALYVCPNGDYTSPHLNRFAKISDLTVLGLFARELLSDSHQYSERCPNVANFLIEKLRRFIEAPQLAFGTSYANRLVWSRLSAALHLSDHLAEWRLQNSNVRKGVAQTLRVSNLPREWWTLPDLEAVIEDRQSRPSDPLAFVTDQNLKSFIQSDWLEAKRCLDAANYRAAVVMAGAAVEGLLLAALLADRGHSIGQDIYRKGLQELIEECCPKYNQALQRGEPKPHRIITTATANLVDQTCRPWRNFIHAGVAARATDSVSVEKARAAISSLELLVAEFK